MIASLTPRNVVVAVLLLLLATVPIYAAVTANAFLVTLFTRVIILGMAACSLNLILGYGGMVSFGHAVYLGIGGYAVGILAQEGVTSGFAQWPVALFVSALFALLVGALSLRTRGVYFIMITLAFAQLVYYFGVGLDRYGADDGLTIRRRSQFAGLINLSDRTQFYYLCLVLLLATIYLIWRLVNSRFGMVIQGARSNDRARRHGVVVRPADRRGRVAVAGGGASHLDPGHGVSSVRGRRSSHGRILADRARTPVPAGCAVCTRRHRRAAGGSAPWLMRCSRSRD